MDDLEVEHRLAFRLHRRAPAGVVLDREQVVEGRKAKLLRELVQVVDVALGQRLDLGKQDRLAGAIEAPVPEGLEVVKLQHVDRLQTAWIDRGARHLMVAVEPGHRRHHSPERRGQEGCVHGGVEDLPGSDPVVDDPDLEQRIHRRGRSLGLDQARTSRPGSLEPGRTQVCKRPGHKGGVRPEFGGILIRRDGVA